MIDNRSTKHPVETETVVGIADGRSPDECLGVPRDLACRPPAASTVYLSLLQNDRKGGGGELVAPTEGRSAREAVRKTHEKKEADAEVRSVVDAHYIFLIGRRCATRRFPRESGMDPRLRILKSIYGERP